MAPKKGTVKRARVESSSAHTPLQGELITDPRTEQQEGL